MAQRGRVTLTQIAQISGVSKATVSLILNGNKENAFAPDTVKKVLEAASVLGYQKNKEQLFESKEIWVLANNLYREEQIRTFQSLQVMAQKELCPMLLYTTSGSLQREQWFWERINPQNVLGVICLEPPKKMDLARKIAAKIPVVTLVSEKHHPIGDVVLINHSQCGTMLAHYLAEQGHHCVGWIGLNSSEKIFSSFSGLFSQIQNEVSIFSEFPREDCVFPKELRQWGKQIASKMLSDNVTAIICASSTIAYGVLDCLKSPQISVPEECAVLTFGDPQLQNFSMPITIINQHEDLAGKMLFELLMDRSSSVYRSIPSGFSMVEYICEFTEENLQQSFLQIHDGLEKYSTTAVE